MDLGVLMSTDDVDGFGRILRARRVAAGLSQQDLAERSGLSVRAIGDLERERTRRPYPASVRHLADALELSPAQRQEFVAVARRRLALAAVLSDSPASDVPHQLPAEPAGFVGRNDVLAELTTWLDRPSRTGFVTAVGGTAGVGKTAVALRWAHEVAARFPDGQLYVNLRGYDTECPVPAGDALAGFLRALGTAGDDIPVDLGERAAAYRSRLAGRRMLIVLDNAGSVEQVRPLLAGSPTCAAVVTSRDSLAGLVARDGAQRVALDLLPSTEAVQLLRELLGRRVDAEPVAAAALADRCCRLPLALRLAAELAASQPGTALATLVDELGDLRHRLDLLDADGDVRTAMRAVFSWSYRRLDAPARSTFRHLSMHPAVEFGPSATAALTGSTPRRAKQILDRLARAHLIWRVGQNSFGQHDLLRAYGRERAEAEDSAANRHSALTELFDHYLCAAAAAMDTLFPAEAARRPGPLPQGPVTVRFTDPAAAKAWLDTMRYTLVVVTGQAAAHGCAEHAIHLGAMLFRYLDSGSHHVDAMAIYRHAGRAAVVAGDPGGEATALTNIGVVALRQGRLHAAGTHFRRALGLCRRTADLAGEARARHNLGVVEYDRCRYGHATRHLRQALAGYRELGELMGQARTAGSLAIIERRQGKYRIASVHLRQSLTACRRAGDRLGVAEALISIGILDLRLGRCAHAATCERRAATICRSLGDRRGEAEALTNLGLVEQRQGDHRRAVDHQREALAAARSTRDQDLEAEVLTNLGVVILRQGEPRHAIGYLRRAVAMYEETGTRIGEVEARNGLGEALLAIGRPELARAQHATALRLATNAKDVEHQTRAHDGLATASAQLSTTSTPV
jgi:tetratricopeptide (TPR) repeat protein/transcriptional regulator with XRE-family HTH domain